jgi:hypothetical protein
VDAVKIQLHEHQEKAVQNMHNGCVLTGGVGSGKTITALSYALLKESGRDIYVITTAKKRDSGDWEKEAALLAVPADSIVVDSWNNIKHYQKVHGAIFIFDEQRLVGTGAWVKAFYDIARKNRWVLLSATPGDTWMDYVPVFIANGFYKNVTEFRQEHVIYSRFSKYPKVEKYIGTGRLIRQRRQVIVEMPMERHTTRHIQTVEVDYDTDVFDLVWKKRWHVYEDRPIKDAGELFRVGRKVVSEHPSRLEMVRQLMEKHPRLVIFYNFDYELEKLRTLRHEWPDEDSSREPVHLAEWNGHKHELTPSSERWIYLVQYTAGSEGWNCTSTDAMVFYSLTYSYKQYAQSQGRIDRMNTPYSDLYYYVLATKSVVDKAVWRALKAKKDFNVRAFQS